MSPEQIWQIVSVGGGTAVLGLMVWLFLTGKIVPDSVVKDRDARIGRLEQERELFRTLAERNQGSQQVQAATMRDLTGAVTAALEAASVRAEQAALKQAQP